MNLPALKKLNPEDFPDLPEPMYPVLEKINDNLDLVFKALSQGLTREENLGQERRVLKVTHGTPIDIQLKQIKGRARLSGAFIQTLEHYKAVGVNVQPGVMRVLVTFDVAPTSDQEVELFFEAVT